MSVRPLTLLLHPATKPYEASYFHFASVCQEICLTSIFIAPSSCPVISSQALCRHRKNRYLPRALSQTSRH
jgi:hypothetical protein